MTHILNFVLQKDLLSSIRVVVLDIGARKAKLDRWTGLGKHLVYYGFELDEEECGRLNQEVANHKTSCYVRYFPLALAKADETRTFYVTERPECSSLLEPNLPAVARLPVANRLEVKRTIEIRTTSLSNWAVSHAIPTVDFIKLDVQGAELEVLCGGANLIGSVLGLLTEVEFIEVYKEQPLFAEVDRWIQSRGFTLFDLSKIRHPCVVDGPRLPSKGQLVWGDALYLRDVHAMFRGDVAEMPAPGDILKLAVLADLCERPDYGLYVLEQAATVYKDKLRDQDVEMSHVYRELLEYLDCHALARSDIGKRQWCRWNLPGRIGRMVRDFVR